MSGPGFLGGKPLQAARDGDGGPGASPPPGKSGTGVPGVPVPGQIGDGDGNGNAGGVRALAPVLSDLETGAVWRILWCRRRPAGVRRGRSAMATRRKKSGNGEGHGTVIAELCTEPNCRLLFNSLTRNFGGELVQDCYDGSLEP